MTCLTQRVALSVGIGVLLAGRAGALQPPTPEQIARYRADGTWAQRVASAKSLGNHLTKPHLVAQTRQKLQRALNLIGGGTGEQVANAPPPAWQGGLPSTGAVKVLVVLVDFPEYPHYASQTVSDVDSKFFANGDASRFPYESLRNFYQRSSYSQLTIGGNVLGWYRAQNSRSYYEGLGSSGREALIMEALNYFDAQGHDFTQYDNDGNGRIDAFYIKWTGPDNGWANFWWAYQTSWYINSSYRLDGKRLDNYVWSWISNPQGGLYQAKVDIHETGHLLGLPDLYDYDSNVGPRGGVGGLDMMDSNWGDHNCFSKFMLDWLTPTTVASGAQTLTLYPSGSAQDCVLFMPGVTPGTLFDEFFMAQYRRRSVGNDTTYPTDGLIIWHVDSTLNSYGTNFLYDNSYTAHKLVRLMEADGLEQIEQALAGANAGDFYLPPKSLGTSTTPNSRDYAGAITGVQVEQLTSAGATMGARFRIGEYPQVVAAGSAIQTQSCPSDSNLDPQEIATVSFSLQNVGTAATSSMTATLLSSGGVTLPSAPQSYGVLAAGGAAVSRSFTFTASGTCGGTLTATLQLQDGVNVLDPVTFTFRLGQATVPLAENFDAVTVPALPAGWTATVAAGSVTPWATTTSISGTFAFAANPSYVSDNRLESPVFQIATTAAELTFRHSYTLEASFDGGLLEISIAGGAFVDFVGAGGSFTSGGYDYTLNSLYGNPLGGRNAWSGSSSGFITTTAILPASAAGHSVRLRWRLGTDDAVAASGWYIDSISVADAYRCCSGSPDFDGDGNVDYDDYRLLEPCGFAPLTTPPAGCEGKDLNHDTFVDQSDFGRFQRCYSGHGTPYTVGCAD